MSDFAEAAIRVPLRSTPAPRVAIRETETGLAIEPVLDETANVDDFRVAFLNAFGTTERLAAEVLFGQLLNAFQTTPEKGIDGTTANAALALIHSIGPRDTIEAMLAQRPDAGSRVAASAMPGTVDATCMAVGAPVPPRRAQWQLAGRLLLPGRTSRPPPPARADPPDACRNGRSAMIETKPRERGLDFPCDCPIDEFPQSMVELTAEQKVALAEAEERLEQRQREWEAIVQALQDNSMAVFRAMRRFRHESEPEQVNRVLASFEDGRFLIDRMGAENSVDQDLAVVLLDLRRQLRDEYGTGPAAIMLIDRAVSAYQDFIRVTGWLGNLSIHIEREFFGRDAPKAEFQGRTIRGLTVEQHLAHLREGLLPLAERSGRVMREALGALESLRAGPSETVERSRPVRIALKL